MRSLLCTKDMDNLANIFHSPYLIIIKAKKIKKKTLSANLIPCKPVSVRKASQ